MYDDSVGCIEGREQEVECKQVFRRLLDKYGSVDILAILPTFAATDDYVQVRPTQLCAH